MTSGIVPLTVNFTNLSGGIISDWVWDFGNGLTTSVRMPQHIYTKTGMYTVTLSVLGEGTPDTLTKVGYISVKNAIESVFIYLPLLTYSHG
jgi:PKD repeat protein